MLSTTAEEKPLQLILKFKTAIEMWDKLAWRKGLRRTWNISPRTHTHTHTHTHTYTPSAMQLPSSTRRVLSAIFAVCKQVFVSRFNAHSLRCIARYYGYQRIFFYRTQRLLLHESVRHIFARRVQRHIR
jgi:hypothetical protein